MRKTIPNCARKMPFAAIFKKAQDTIIASAPTGSPGQIAQFRLPSIERLYVLNSSGNGLTANSVGGLFQPQGLVWISLFVIKNSPKPKSAKVKAPENICAKSLCLLFKLFESRDGRLLAHTCGNVARIYKVCDILSRDLQSGLFHPNR